MSTDVAVNVGVFAGMAALFASVLVLFVYSLVWAYHDAQARGKSGWIVVLLVMLIDWPLSLLLWCVFRPKLLAPEWAPPVKS